MSHLGRWLSAQIDGELDGVERDRVLNHLAGCDSCREEAVALRVLKRRMFALGESSADSAIAGRVIERARSEQEVVAVVADEFGWPDRFRPLGLTARQPWLSWRVATGTASTALAAIGVLAFMLGGAPAGRPAPMVSPAVDAFWMQHSNDTGQRWVTGAQARKSSTPVFMPGSAVPGSAVPGSAVPGSDVPGSAAPGNDVPGSAAPGNDVPGSAAQGSVAPGSALPAHVPPGSARPADVPAFLRLDAP